MFDGAKEREIQAELGRAWMIDRAWNEITERAWEWIKQFEYDPEDLEDDDEVRRLYVHDWLGDSGDYDADQLLTDETCMPAVPCCANGCARRATTRMTCCCSTRRSLSLAERSRRDQNAIDAVAAAVDEVGRRRT